MIGGREGNRGKQVGEAAVGSSGSGMCHGTEVEVQGRERAWTLSQSQAKGASAVQASETQPGSSCLLSLPKVQAALCCVWLLPEWLPCLLQTPQPQPRDRTALSWSWLQTQPGSRVRVQEGPGILHLTGDLHPAQLPSLCILVSSFAIHPAAQAPLCSEPCHQEVLSAHFCCGAVLLQTSRAGTQEKPSDANKAPLRTFLPPSP